MIDDVYIKSKFKRKTMSRVPSSDTNAKGRINRKINIDRIRCSMQNFNIIKQNKVMVENRLMQKKNNEDELE
jgi:hypothetical protein